LTGPKGAQIVNTILALEDKCAEIATQIADFKNWLSADSETFNRNVFMYAKALNDKPARTVIQKLSRSHT
jgi:hypothetical protein